MRITIQFDTDNAAFVEDFASELHKVLQSAEMLCNANKSLTQHLRDSNGNSIGIVTKV